tara:strand:- start:318 stop:599 length:282 start_codon:yes stop_codon:yes gene_type:complete
VEAVVVINQGTAPSAATAAQAVEVQQAMAANQPRMLRVAQGQQIKVWQVVIPAFLTQIKIIETAEVAVLVRLVLMRQLRLTKQMLAAMVLPPQ